MSHLTADRFAALVDEPATAEERRHLAACPACAEELEAHRRLVTLAALERERPFPALSSWEGLRDALRDAAPAPVADLTAPVAPLAAPRPARRSLAPVARRAAAVAVLLAGGAAIGRLSAGVPLFSQGSAGARLVAITPAGPSLRQVLAGNDQAATFRSSDEAMAALAAAERQYQAAAAFLVENDPASRPMGDASHVAAARLAALDNVAAAARSALYEAPHDPVVNRYYLAAMGAREAALRQISATLPADVAVGGF